MSASTLILCAIYRIKRSEARRSPAQRLAAALVRTSSGKYRNDMSEYRDEALRKIGRNVVLFQQLESVLKFLAAAQHPSTPLSAATAARTARAESIRTQTLGQVAGDIVRSLFADSDEHISTTPAEISEPWLGFSFRIELDPASVDEHRRVLKALIDERNDLVHHLCLRWNLEDRESCRALSQELDAQRGRIVRELERYREYAKCTTEMARELKAFIDSDHGKRHIDLAFLQQSRLAAVLASVAKEHAGSDGWTLLATAGQRLSALIPDEFAELKKLHGNGSLQKLVQSIGLFELRSDRTPGSGTQVYYRLQLR